LLKQLGFGPFKFYMAPSGKGAVEAWVLNRYPDEVQVLRSKRFQKGLRLIAVRDGDGIDLASRKQQFDRALTEAGQDSRSCGEKIATVVPCRNIETWLLVLLDSADLDEMADYKSRFEASHGTKEREALRQAAARWTHSNATSLDSLDDGKSEVKRIDP